ncbi:hypothetical protein NDU88_005319 [Pleurodeles waltl]|uniref:Uncharacterized protein n=1 Tax=Pleurodeles waltl TaxID=8319 RepID=A0AAV7PMB0_PLEWA|nr:hypothetical protein NDU88_005319 [Pleurodeles waltl]
MGRRRWNWANEKQSRSGPSGLVARKETIDLQDPSEEDGTLADVTMGSRGNSAHQSDAEEVVARLPRALVR